MVYEACAAQLLELLIMGRTQGSGRGRQCRCCKARSWYFTCCIA